MTRSRAMRWYFAGAGACDLTTGLLLVFVPGPTLSLMRVPAVGTAEVFLRWIGVFVGSVGAAYLLPFAVAGAARPTTARTVLAMTAWTRAVVALFVASAIAGGSLAAAWLTVAVVDGSLAALQTWMLVRGQCGWRVA